MQSIPDARHQTFEEIYGPPENFLEIEVSWLVLCSTYILMHSLLGSQLASTMIRLEISTQNIELTLTN
jgi:hypothetical protein